MRAVLLLIGPLRRGRLAPGVAVGAGVLVVLLAGFGGVLHAANADVPNTEFAKYWPLMVLGGIAYGGPRGGLAGRRPPDAASRVAVAHRRRDARRRGRRRGVRHRRRRPTPELAGGR